MSEPLIDIPLNFTVGKGFLESMKALHGEDALNVLKEAPLKELRKTNPTATLEDIKLEVV